MLGRANEFALLSLIKTLDYLSFIPSDLKKSDGFKSAADRKIFREMTCVKEMLKSESANTRTIHLYLEGMFWKAYQRSAYQVAEALPRGLHGEAAVREVGRSRGVFPRIPEGDVAETFAQGNNQLKRTIIPQVLGCACREQKKPQPSPKGEEEKTGHRLSINKRSFISRFLICIPFFVPHVRGTSKVNRKAPPSS